MTITATFSNGFSDTYKGDRAVTAAWAIIRKSDGFTLASGHSLDAAKAAKTAAGNLAHRSLAGDFDLPEHPLRYIEGPDYRDNSKTRRAKREHNAARLDFIRSLTTIEVVSL
jgi:hypothetical protein